MNNPKTSSICMTIDCCRGSFGEPDCSPHPFDIMAIFALYQTIP